jgi:hypothetical protein
MKRYLMMIKYRQYRWAARLTGILCMVFFVSWFTAVGIEDFKPPDQSPDIFFVIILFTLCFLTYILSWYAEIVGGALLTIAAILFPVYAHYNADVAVSVAVIHYALPFLLPGVLFMIAWRIKVIRKEMTNGKLV